MQDCHTRVRVDISWSTPRWKDSRANENNCSDTSILMAGSSWEQACLVRFWNLRILSSSVFCHTPDGLENFVTTDNPVNKGQGIRSCWGKSLVGAWQEVVERKRDFQLLVSNRLNQSILDTLKRGGFETWAYAYVDNLPWVGYTRGWSGQERGVHGARERQNLNSGAEYSAVPVEYGNVRHERSSH